MNPFEFFGVARVIFGRGESRRIGAIVATLGRRAMILYNGEGLGERLATLIESAGVSCVLRRQKAEPQVADINAAIAEARRAECDCVVGVGGGSAIDAAKAIAGLLTNGGEVTDYMEVVGKGHKLTRPAAPWVALPATAGTGAEATRNAVIGLPEKKFKASIRSEWLLPRVAIIDAELGTGVPPAVTAASGMDALCQLIESYTSTGANLVTDSLALRGIKLATSALPKAFANGQDLDAREAMAIAAHLSGVTLTSAGLGAVHGFAAPLGANFPIPHGVICAALLPHVLAANIGALRRLKSAGDPAAGAKLSRYADVGRLLSQSDLDEVAAADECVKITMRLARQFSIPRLSEYGLSDEKAGEMVALARKASSMRFNPVALSDKELETVLKLGILGGN